MRHLPAIAALAAALIATGEAANAQACSSRDALTGQLASKYGEMLTAGGLRDSQSILEVWVSPDGGTWTLIMTRANGVSCVMAAGTNWRESLEPEVAMGTPS